MMSAVFLHILRHDRGAAWALAVILALAAGPALGQANGTWSAAAVSGASWGTASNWVGNTIGTGTGFTATFAPDIASDFTVTNNAQRALGSLVFGTVAGTNSGNWLVSGSQITVTNGNPAANATITVNSLGSATISNVIAAGTANNALLVKNGTGKLILTNTANSIGNKISITAGTLEINNERVLGAQPGAYTADQLQISNGAVLRTTATATISSSRGITIGSGGGTISANGGGLALATRVSGAGNTLAVTGSNAVTLTNSTVGTNVNWDFASNSGLRTFFESTNALGTGSVQVRSGVRLTSQSMATGTIANAVTLNSGAGLTARSTGGAQTYTNVTFPSSGSIVLNNDDQTTSNITIASGGELTGVLNVSTQQGGTNSVGSVFLDGVFSGAGGLTKSGTGASGRVVLRGANTYTGTTTVSTGTLQLGNGGTVGSLSTSSVITGVAGATFVFNRSDKITAGVDFTSSPIAGGMNLSQVGSGTVVLANTNSYTGKTSIANGTLEISAAAQLGGNPGSFVSDQVTISNGGKLRTVGGSVTGLGNRGIVIGSGGGNFDINGGAMSFSNTVTGSGQTMTVTGANALTLTNTTGVASSVNWDFASNSDVRTFFRGSNALGTGTVTVRNGNRLVSETTPPTGGQVGNAVTLESGAGLSARSSAGAVEYTTVTLPSSGTVIFNRDDQVTAALTIASGKVLDGILTVDTSQQAANAVGDVTLSGNFSGASGGITKSGTGASGRLILGGVNTYGGNTTIGTGTLALAATSSIVNSAAISVASGAAFDVSAVSGGFSLGAGQVLGGSGTVLGNVTSLGTIAPGSSPGTLTFTDDLSLGSGSILSYELSGTNTVVGSGVNDLITLSGDLTLAGTINVTETDANSFLSADVGDSWRLFNFDGTLFGGLSLGTMPALSGGKTFGIDTSTPNQVNLVVTVPEPATIVTVMAGLGMLGMVAARRRLKSFER